MINPENQHIRPPRLHLQRQSDGTEKMGQEVLVQRDDEGEWEVYQGGTLRASGLWLDGPQEKQVPRGGLLGWLGFKKTVTEAANGKIDADEVKTLKFIKEEIGDTFRDVPLPPAIVQKPWKARRFEVALKVDQEGSVQGRTTIHGTAKESSSSIPVDLGGFAGAVYVIGSDGEPIPFKRSEEQVLIEKPLGQGEDFAVTVGFQGRPQAQSHPAIPSDLGWLSSDTAVVTMNGVENASSWMPTDNDPANKAPYSFELEVPKNRFAVANGELKSVKETEDSKVFQYASEYPMASYLASVNVFDEESFTTSQVGDLGVIHPKGMEEEVQRDFARHDEMMDDLVEKLGPYPFETYNVVVAPLPVDTYPMYYSDGDRTVTRDASYQLAFEAQTRSVYQAESVTGEGFLEGTAYHELAHQWFGNTVTKASERDIWVAEGFPSYGNWLWVEKKYGTEAMDRMAEATHKELQEHKFTDTLADPARDRTFSHENYERMRLSMHALRKEIGDDQFFATMRGVLDAHKHQAITTAQMAETMNKLNDGKLGEFFDQWLHSKTVPDLPESGRESDGI